jgi:hypothetical protein
VKSKLYVVARTRKSGCVSGSNRHLFRLAIVAGDLDPRLAWMATRILSAHMIHELLGWDEIWVFGDIARSKTFLGLCGGMWLFLSLSRGANPFLRRQQLPF